MSWLSSPHGAMRTGVTFFTRHSKRKVYLFVLRISEQNKASVVMNTHLFSTGIFCVPFVLLCSMLFIAGLRGGPLAVRKLSNHLSYA